MTITSLLCAAALGQQRLPSMPGYENRGKRTELSRAVSLASFRASWIDDHRYIYWDSDGEATFDADLMMTVEAVKSTEVTPPTEHPNSGRKRPSRGRQYTETFTPDGKTKAYHQNGNVFVEQGENKFQLTKDGDPGKRIKFGTGSWVYGEELGQNEAMGLTDDGSKLWLYRFDDSMVKDYHLAINQNDPQSKLYVEAYPKPGQPNPEVDLFVADLETKELTKVQIRDGEFDQGVGHYVYSIQWSPDDSRLLFYRTNRKQNIRDFCSADPATGEVTILDRETNPNAWVENKMPMVFFDDDPEIESSPELKGKALWLSARSGNINFGILDLVDGGFTPLTSHAFDVRSTVQLDLKSGVLHYMAAGEMTPAFHQLHRINLDGTGHRMLTRPDFHHTVNLSPGGRFFIDRQETIENAPVYVLRDNDGRQLKVLATSDVSEMASVGYQPTERFRFKSADGKYTLNGHISFPPDFDRTKKYPVIVNVYGGPGGPMSSSFSERYRLPSSPTEYGFIVVGMENRGLGGRGRAFRNALYQNMGVVEIDDQAAGVKSIWDRRYIDKTKIGVQGTSYGGYSTLMALLRYPDVYKAGISSSCVSTWANYDTIYTERYMGLLPESKEAYDRGSTMTYAKNLEGWLMVYYGTSDDNTHPANSYQIISALQRAGKSFEVQVGVDRGHSGVNRNRALEFFIERLVMS